jgi:hypothetical protein
MVEKSADSPPTGDALGQPGWISVLAHLLLLFGAAVAVFLASQTFPGRLGAFLVAAGLALLICPPRVRVDGKLWAAGGALVVAASMALLPHAWFPEPTWRQALIAAGVPLPASVTPMPQVTSFWLAVFAMAALIALFGQAHPLRSREQLALAVVGSVICGVYASLALAMRLAGWEIPLDRNPRVFGLFWNINHTSTFLVTGCMLSLAILSVAFRGRHWFAGSLVAVSLAVCASGLFFFTTSRGAIISLFAGVLLWFTGLGRAHRSKPLLVSFLSVLLASFLLFFASQSAASSRLLTLFGLKKGPGMSLGAVLDPTASERAESGKPAEDFRALIFADTLRIVGDFPLTGTGLGTFQSIFPLYRERSLSHTPVLHPESDWLMLAAEAGIPVVVLLCVAIGISLRRAWPLREHAYWPLRWGILCAGVSALLHGFVDVPAHGPPLGFWLLAIFGIGFQIWPRDSPARSSRIQHGLFVAAGLGAFALGVPLIKAGWFGGSFWPPDAGSSAAMTIDALQAEGKFKEAVEVGRKAVRVAPLDWVLYTQIGGGLLGLHANQSEIDNVFAAGSLVNPKLPGVPIEQGLLWIGIDPSKTTALWQEAVRRHAHIDRVRGGGEGGVSLYARLVNLAAEYPEVQRQLLTANAQRADLALIWLDGAAPALVAMEIPGLASDPAFLGALTESGRRRFLQAWYRKADRETLLRFIEDRPDWESAAWPVQVRRMVDARNFKELTLAVARRYQIRLDLPPPGSGDGEAFVGVPESAVGSFYAAWRKGNTVTARRILKEEARAGRTPPAEIWRIGAALAAYDEQWASAWQNLERYLRESGLSSFP